MMTSKDFANQSFKVAINRIQQIALEKAQGQAPCPADQLAMLAKKKGKEERLILSCMSIIISSI